MAAQNDHENKAAKSPIVVGHRGASGYIPEHTLAAYYIAIQQGADSSSPILSSLKTACSSPAMKTRSAGSRT